MDPSGYTLDTVQNRGEFLICRGHQRIHASSHPSPVLVLMPRSEALRPESLRMLEHELGDELVKRRGLMRFQARTFMLFGNSILPWTQHVRAGRDLVRAAFEAANKMGDLTYTAYCGNQMNTNLLAAGDPLAQAASEAEHGLAFAKKARYGFVADTIATQLELWAFCREPRADLRGVLHDQTGGHRHGIIHKPEDHRVAWRSFVGSGQLWRRSNLSFHSARHYCGKRFEHVNSTAFQSPLLGGLIRGPARYSISGAYREKYSKIFDGVSWKFFTGLCNLLGSVTERLHQLSQIYAPTPISKPKHMK